MAVGMPRAEENMCPQDHMSSSVAAKPQPPPHQQHIPRLYSLHVLHRASPKSRYGGQEGGHGHDPAVEEGHLAEVVEGGIVAVKQQGCQGEEEQQPVEQDHRHRAAWREGAGELSPHPGRRASGAWGCRGAWQVNQMYQQSSMWVFGAGPGEGAVSMSPSAEA